MIARVWRGVVAKSDGDAYAEIPGNEGVWMLRREVGEDYETAVFYPEDERFLIRRDEFSTHYNVDTTK